MTDSQEILVTVGRNVRKLRESNGWSQEELMVKTGLDQADISRIERGLVDVGVTKLVKLAKAFSVQLNDLYLI